MYVPELKRPESKSDPDMQMTSRLRESVAALLKGEPNRDAFTVPMQKFLATASGKSWWEWIAEHGALTSFVFSEVEDRGESRRFRYRINLGENHYWLAATVTADGKIAQIHLW
jgi:hypothetical protein